MGLMSLAGQGLKSGLLELKLDNGVNDAARSAKAEALLTTSPPLSIDRPVRMPDSQLKSFCLICYKT